MAYATVAQVKDHLRGVSLTALGTTTEQDDQIQAAADQATEQVDALAGRTFTSTTETRVFDGPGTDFLWLPDLISLTSWSEEGEERAADEMVLYPLHGSPKLWARRSSGRFTAERAALSLTGQWGYAATVPAAVSRACALLAAAAILRRLGPSESLGTSATVQGALSERYEGGAYAADEARYEREAETLLAPYRRVRVR